MRISLGAPFPLFYINSVLHFPLNFFFQIFRSHFFPVAKFIQSFVQKFPPNKIGTYCVPKFVLEVFIVFFI